jgi:methyltransferase family protein
MPDSSRTAQERYPEVAAAPSDIQQHLPRLRREARGTVLELGVRGGSSTVALLAGLEERGGTLWSVDVDPASAAIFPGHHQWCFVLADSRDESPVLEAGLPDELDVLFIDTIHTYEQVRDELAVWGDRVVEGGVILFHDTDSYPPIRRAISEWCKSRRVPFEFRGASNGLGVAYPGQGGMAGILAWIRRETHLIWFWTLFGLTWLVRLPRRIAGRAKRKLVSDR